MTTVHQAVAMMLSNRQTKIQPIHPPSDCSLVPTVRDSKLSKNCNDKRPDQQNEYSSEIQSQHSKSDLDGSAMHDSNLPPEQSTLTLNENEDSSFQPAKKSRETVAIIIGENNSSRGEILTKSLSRSGCIVVVVLSKFNSQLVCSLLKYKRVSVCTVDNLDDPTSIAKLIDGSDRAVLVCSYFEKFENSKEEKRALLLIKACQMAGISNLTFSTLEDTEQLRRMGLKSQIQPKKDGSFHPTFRGMKAARRAARKAKIQISYVITSYLDYERSNASICFISKGKDEPLIVRSYALEEPYAPKAKRIQVQSKKLSKKVVRLLKKKQNTMAEAKNNRILLSKFLNELLFCPAIKQTSFMKPLNETAAREKKRKKSSSESSLTTFKCEAGLDKERDSTEVLPNLLNELLFIST